MVPSYVREKDKYKKMGSSGKLNLYILYIHNEEQQNFDKNIYIETS